MMEWKRASGGVKASLLRWAMLGVLCLLALPAAHAQLPDSLSSRARISVLTVNPGEAVYSLWGHSALRVMDPDAGFDAVFNWGTFDPARPWFIPRFAYGDMQYELSVEAMSRFFQSARAQERGVVEQDLRLDANRKQAIWELLLDNMQPENRAYAYDFVRDNCSTRILDLLTAVDAVQLAPSDSVRTYRGMVDAYVHQEAWLDLGIDLAFGRPMDRDVTPTDVAFLPLALENLLDEASTTEGASLVAGKRTLLDLPWQAAEPSFTRVELLFWAIGVLILVYTLRFRGGPTSLDRVLLAVLGSMGIFLLLMWVATLHWVTAWNVDLLWALPSHLVVAIVWKRWNRLESYLRISGLVMLAALILQLAGFQPMHPAMIVPVLAIGLRFVMLGRREPAAQTPTPSAA